ncbi:kinase-like domain-containing protein [Rhizophagus irregularis DAOM 181602=DAOM 197198]|nr:kinase-like domain-containing protein [Rhizophagus irregularis DAOM 181602=DAOM 197198]
MYYSHAKYVIWMKNLTYAFYSSVFLYSWELTEEQSLLIDKLILNEELKKRFKNNGLCKDCKQPKASRNWCQCEFQQNFKNWTSGNNEVDKFIQKAQPKANNSKEILEWIEYDKFENVEYLSKGGFGTIYKAILKDGFIEKWESENNQWKRNKMIWGNIYENFPVVLKCLHNSQDITADFLGEIESHTIARLCRPANVKPSQDEYKKIYGVLPYVAPEVLRGKEYTQGSDIYGFGIITYEVCTGLPPYHDIPHEVSFAINVCRGLRPKTNYKIPQAILNIIKKCWDADPLKRLKAQELYKLVEADKINEKFTSTSLPYNGTTLSYTTNPQAVYTSRLLDFKNLPEPKNVIDNNDNNNLFEEYSKSLEIDIKTLNLDKN